MKHHYKWAFFLLPTAALIWTTIPWYDVLMGTVIVILIERIYWLVKLFKALWK